HYAIWEVIEFGDSYKVPTNTDLDNASTRKDDELYGRTITITTEDMQRKKNNVKARTTLLLSLPDEHQLRFGKYKTAKELWATILKIFGGNEATKKKKKNLLKQQYGNFKAEVSKTLEQTFNRLQVIVSQLQFIDVEVEKDDLNQKFITIGAQIEGRLTEYKEREVKYIEKIRTLEMYRASNLKCIKILDKELEELKLEKDGLDGKLAGLPEFVDDTVTDYSKLMPNVASTSAEGQNKDSSTSEDVASPKPLKPFVKFVKPKDSQPESKTKE
nr:ribonuclease H-like domain-containing protein [Tanacetum cinerariifolium]